jgi:hypothetical protein
MGTTLTITQSHIPGDMNIQQHHVRTSNLPIMGMFRDSDMPGFRDIQ